MSEDARDHSFDLKKAGAAGSDIPLQAAEIRLDAIGQSLEADWHSLARQSGTGAFFASHAFVSAFAEEFSEFSQVSVLTLRDTSGCLVGLVPLMRNSVRRGPSLGTRYAYLMHDFAFLAGGPQGRVLPVRQISTLLGLEAAVLRSEWLVSPAQRSTVLRAAVRAISVGDWTVALFVIEDAMAAGLSTSFPRSRLQPLGRELKLLRPPVPSAGLASSPAKEVPPERQAVGERFYVDAQAAIEVVRGREEVARLRPASVCRGRQGGQLERTSAEGGGGESWFPHFSSRTVLSVAWSNSDRGNSSDGLYGFRVDGALVSAMLCFVYGGSL